MISAVVSFSLAATLAFHPYAVDRHAAQPAPTSTPPAEDPAAGWDDEPVADPPPPTPAPATTPPPADAPPPAGPQTHEVARPQTHSGIGLIVAASVVGAGAWGTAIGKIVLVERCSDSIDDTMTTTDAQVSAFTCFQSARGILGLSIAGWFLNWATWGLAAGAGAVRGKHDGVGYAWDGAPDRVAGGYIGGGAAMLGVGVLGIGLTRIFSLNILRCDVNADLNKCLKRKFNGYFAAVQVSSSLVAAGLGMMIYGIVYGKNRRQFENRRVTDLQIVPDVSLFRENGGSNYNGLALTGKF